MSPGVPAVLIEAFSERPFAGNGAAVVLLEEPCGDPWMQAVAGSLKQSETAFLLAHGDRWLLRWFTPLCEVPLCGHGTLASLLALQHWGLLRSGVDTLFLTRSGPLPVAIDGRDPGRGRIQLPSSGLLSEDPPRSLLALLQGRLGCRPEAYWRSPLGYRVALLPEGAPLAAMSPVAADLDGEERQGLVLMQAVCQEAGGRGETPRVGGSPADYQIRFFAPGLGIEEDPVTGSAHALVAPYWLERLGRSSVVGWQCSDRPGGMRCEAASSGMIRLTGTGHLLWDGTLWAQSPLSAGGPPGDGATSSELPGGWSALAPGPSSTAAADIPS